MTPSPNGSPRTKSKRRTSAPERQLLPKLKRSESFDFVNETMLQEMNRDLIDAVRKAKQEENSEGQQALLRRTASLPTEHGVVSSRDHAVADVAEVVDGDGEAEGKRIMSTGERRKSTGSDI